MPTSTKRGGVFVNCQGAGKSRVADSGLTPRERIQEYSQKKNSTQKRGKEEGERTQPETLRNALGG